MSTVVQFLRRKFVVYMVKFLLFVLWSFEEWERISEKPKIVIQS